MADADHIPAPGHAMTAHAPPCPDGSSVRVARFGSSRALEAGAPRRRCAVTPVREPFAAKLLDLDLGGNWQNTDIDGRYARRARAVASMAPGGGDLEPQHCRQFAPPA